MIEINKTQKIQIGRRFKLIRKHLNLTQAKMAALLGITQTTITGIEKGKSLPTISSILCLMDKYHVSIKWLLTGAGNMIEQVAEFMNSMDWQEYNDEIRELFFYIKTVPFVREYVLERFAIFKLRHKKIITELLKRQEQSFQNGKQNIK